jgi:hypothetical protein
VRTDIFRGFCEGRRCLTEREMEGTRCEAMGSWPRIVVRCLVCGRVEYWTTQFGALDAWHGAYLAGAA